MNMMWTMNFNDQQTGRNMGHHNDSGWVNDGQ